MASILVVCTGNICRSPIAEGMIRAAVSLHSFGDDAVEVSSAGTNGWEGSAAMPESVQAASERGVDIIGHIARRLTDEMLDEADLVVCMAMDHREVIEAERPDVAARTFTLKELVRLLEDLPGRAPNLQARVKEADDLRRGGFDGNPMDEDIADPLGFSIETYRAVAWELQAWCERLVAGLAASDEEG
jgi:protein-tyrosine phosphatase